MNCAVGESRRAAEEIVPDCRGVANRRRQIVRKAIGARRRRYWT
jgi:hypothetical protein